MHNIDCYSASCSGLLAFVVVLGMLIAGCDGILDVDRPTIIAEEELDDPQNAELIVNGLISDFENAFDTYIVMGGVLGNELKDGTFTAARWPIDQRTIQSQDDVHPAYDAYNPLQTARWSADEAVEKLQGWSDDEVDERRDKLATAAAYSGYSHVLLGEGYCSMAIDLGPEIDREEVWERALDRFALAITEAEAAGNADMRNMAYLGQARALHNLDRIDEAATAAAEVEEDFEIVMTASDASERRQNSVFVQMDALNVTISEIYRDLEVEGEPDPRVNVTDEEAAPAGVPIFTTDKYDSFGASIPIARWAEAQLIIAEAEGGQEAVDIINDLRQAHGLEGTFESSDEAEIQEQIIEERQREFFLESHALYDLTHYDLSLFPEPGSSWRDGEGTYGNQRCMPLPDVERDNNPNI